MKYKIKDRTDFFNELKNAVELLEKETEASMLESAEFLVFFAALNTLHLLDYDIERTKKELANSVDLAMQMHLADEISEVSLIRH